MELILVYGDRFGLAWFYFVNESVFTRENLRFVFFSSKISGQDPFCCDNEKNVFSSWFNYNFEGRSFSLTSNTYRDHSGNIHTTKTTKQEIKTIFYICLRSVKKTSLNQRVFEINFYFQNFMKSKNKRIQHHPSTNI